MVDFLYERDSSPKAHLEPKTKKRVWNKEVFLYSAQHSLCLGAENNLYFVYHLTQVMCHERKNQISCKDILNTYVKKYNK